MTMLAPPPRGLPEGPSAADPPEARGLRRDDVRLLVAAGGPLRHVRFRDIGRFLGAGDLLVVNTSATRAAAVDIIEPRRSANGAAVVHFSTRLDDGSWVVELRSAGGTHPVLDASVGEGLTLPREARLRLLEPYAPAAGGNPDGVRLWRARVEVPGADVEGFLADRGRPIRYGHAPEPWPLQQHQTIFATQVGSAEMPSAGRPFTAELVVELVTRGVALAPLTLHAGVSSLESAEPPYPERVEVPRSTARLVELTHRSGARVIAVGTTVVRALESAAEGDGSVRPLSGWTDLVLGPERPARIVDGLVTGWHDARSSHLRLLEAVAGHERVQRAYVAAAENGYLWHEFGDACLLLRP